MNAFNPNGRSISAQQKRVSIMNAFNPSGRSMRPIVVFIVIVCAIFVVTTMISYFSSYFSDTVVPFYADPVSLPGTAATPTDTTERAASIVTAPVEHPSSSAFQPGESYNMNSFRLWVPENVKCQFGRHLGNDYFGLYPEDRDTLFCVVPICVENTSNETRSLTGITWYLYSSSGMRFEIHPSAYFYLEDTDAITIKNSKPIILSDIPPTITRSGSLVFVVIYKAQISETLTLEASRLFSSAKFEIPNRLP